MKFLPGTEFKVCLSQTLFLKTVYFTKSLKTNVRVIYMNYYPKVTVVIKEVSPAI